MERPPMGMKKLDTLRVLRLLGKIVIPVLILPLLIVGGINIATALTAHSSMSMPSPPTHKIPTPAPNTIQYDNIQQTPTPGAVQVTVALAEYTIVSSQIVFHAGTTYYFVVSNHGQQVHEFMIMPEKPDGSELPPDLQYKEQLIEIEQIAPGTTMRINYTFSATGAGRYEIACQMRGHYQAGMKLPIRVVG
ncbi:MAG: hypothetical protein ACR2H5_09580 [Ktedonobacteraceae bacterium]